MNPATLLARLVVEALGEAAVRDVVLCPGSRSAPLAYALAAASTGSRLRLHVRHDERVAAFTALGVGLAGAAGAVVTTSGTAVGNLHPAVLEAHHANRPLVVLTADRPAALRGTWANQTSELQAGLFGAAVRARLDLADTDAAKDPDVAREALAAALAAAHGAGPAGRPGPIHLNLGFTEPLVPEGDDEPLPSREPALAAASPRPAEPGGASSGSELVLRPGPRTVVLAGDGAGAAARSFAEAAALPLLAEPSSGARSGPHAVGPYRLLLELPAFGGAVERVVAFGRPTLSRPVTRLLARPEVDVVLVSPFVDWPDPGRPVARGRAARLDPAPGGESWLRAWQAAGTAATRAVDATLDADAAAGRLTGPLLAREVVAALGDGETLLAAASNPVRDLDLAAHPREVGAVVRANRGLAGIDGTVSTATGVALASGASTRVLIGDVAFLHDAGALLGEPGRARPHLQVLVLNDDGGGIFSLLEYGELAERSDAEGAAFDRIFGTPHGADLGALCRGYGVRHRLVRDVAELRAALAGPVVGTSVVEVRASRARLRELHARLSTAVHAAVLASG